MAQPAAGQQAAAAKVEAADAARIEAWKKGDLVALGAGAANDIEAWDGTRPNGQNLGKKAYLDRFVASKIKPTMRVQYEGTRILGADASVAIVRGVMTDSAASDSKPLNFTAIYHNDGQAWKLIRYRHSARGMAYNVVGQSAVPAGATGSTSHLTAEQRKISDSYVLFLDSLTRRILWRMELLLDDDYVAGKKAYIEGKHRDPSDAPEVMAVFNPRVTILGAKRDVAILHVVRGDATGGAAYGGGYRPTWRAVSDQMTIWRRSGPDKDDWKFYYGSGASHMTDKQRPPLKPLSK